MSNLKIDAARLWGSLMETAQIGGTPDGGIARLTLSEDDSRVRDRTAARNLALLRKIALNIVGRDVTSKASVRARRKRAAWNDAYMLKLLIG